MEQPKFDSLIFDMDGTLWDAVDTYAEIWNVTYQRMGMTGNVTREMLLGCMGMTLTEIIDLIAEPQLDRELFAKTLRIVDSEYMPRFGGRLYPMVKELIPQLAERYQLFMVSNCGPDGLQMFLDFTGLRPYFVDTLTNGETHLPKDENITILMQRHGLKLPVYIGDTEGDCLCSHAAGIPFMHATYGFGEAPNADFSGDSFKEIAEFFLQ